MKSKTWVRVAASVVLLLAIGSLGAVGTSTNYVPRNRTISTTAPLAGGGDLTGDRTLSIQQANGSQGGYLSASDWNAFNGKVSGSRTITTTSPLAGGGDLSADRTLTIQQADGSQSGYLSSTDWGTFNSKISSSRSVLTSSPLTGGGDLSTDRTLGIQAADNTHSGYYTPHIVQAFGKGTNYVATTTSTAITFGGGGAVQPVISLDQAGTYLIRAHIVIDFSVDQDGSTDPQSTLTLRRTNNTAANLTNPNGDVVSTTLISPIGGIQSATGSDGTGPDSKTAALEAIYTTANTTDQITIFASGATLDSLAHAAVREAQIIAERIY